MDRLSENGGGVAEAMDVSEVAQLLTAITAIVASLITGLRRLLKEIRLRAYEQARAELLQEEAKRTIEAKNAELDQLRKEIEDLKSRQKAHGMQ